MPTPIASASKAPSAGVTINRNQNLATHIIAAVGAVLAATGLSQVHGIFDLITNSGVIGGLLVTGLSMAISHWNVGGANDNTIDFINRVLVSLTPGQSAGLMRADGANPTQGTAA